MGPVLFAWAFFKSNFFTYHILLLSVEAALVFWYKSQRGNYADQT